MTASFCNQAAEPDAPMQFLEAENKNTIHNPDREGLVLKSALSDLQSTSRLQVWRCSDVAAWSELQHMLSVLFFSSSQQSFANCTEHLAAEARL